MASNPPAKCCTVGVKHEGESTGNLQTIAGTETYVTVPKSPKADVAIIILPDVIGHKFINAQLIADQFAENGYFTIMPDLFHGDPVSMNPPEGFDIMAWLKGESNGGVGGGHLPPRVEPVVKAAIKWLREEKGVKKIGAVGYCFGGKYVVRGLAKGEGIDVGYTAHQSFVDEEELQKIAGPLSIAAAETDSIFTTDLRHKSEEILKEVKQPYQMNLYSGTEHGFAVRGDIKDPVKKYAKEQAFLQAVQWFDEHLK